MAKVTDAIIKLAEVDAELRNVRARLDAGRRSIEDSRAEVEAIEQKLNTFRDEKTQARKRIDELNVEVMGIQEQINKAKAQQSVAKTNAEYRILAKQIEERTSEMNKFEEDELQQMEKLDALEEGISEASEKCDEWRRRLAGVESSVGEESGKLNAGIEQLKARRGEITGAVDDEDLDRYERILAHRGDAGAAPIIVSDNGGGVCSMCGISLTSQMLSMVYLGEKIVTCRSCGRVLYVKESG